MKKKRIKCKECKRRITLTYIECRCGDKYCGKHRYPDAHGCAFDHKKYNKEQLNLKLPKIRKRKLEEI